MSEHKYQVIAKDRVFFVKADGFKINKDEGTVEFFDLISVSIKRFKWCFVLNNIIAISIIDEEEKI